MKNRKGITALSLVIVLIVTMFGALPVSASNYSSWKQYDSQWADFQLGSGTGTTMQKIGCRVTAIAIVCAKLGLVDSNFTPGTFAKQLKDIGAFTSSGAMKNWTDPEKVVNGLKMVKKVELSGTQAEKAAVIANYTTNGYACTIAVRNAGHYVAADYVAGDKVYMHNPGSSKTDLFAAYANSGITSIRVFKSTTSNSATVVTSCNHSYNKSGYCTKCGEEYYISLSSMNDTYEAVKNDVPVRNRPYSPDTIIGYLSKGSKVTVVGSGKNSAGNVWYKISDGTWIFSGNLTKSSNETVVSQPQAPAVSDTSIRFELETVPSGNLPYGKSFSLKGWFRSDSPIAEARGYILDANQNVVMDSGSASSTTSNYKIQGYKLDKNLKFSKLSPGGYYLKYYVRDANGDTATWMSDMFYIVK